MSSSTDGPGRPSPENAVKVGYVRRAHGIKGAVIVRILDDESEQFQPGNLLSTDHADHPTVTVASAHPHKDGWLVLFEEASTRNEAEELRGTSFYIDVAERRVLEEDEFWPEELVGLTVVDGNGTQLGVVTDVVAGAAQDRLVVAAGDTTVEVPLVSAIVTEISPEDGAVTVDPPQGLFPG